MPTLHEIQQQFAAFVYEDESKDGGKNIRQLEAEIVGENPTDGNISPYERLSLYRSSILGIQTDGLAAIYPVTRQLVGEKFFTAMASAYLREHPSPSGDLHRLGEQLANFIDDYSPAESLPYLGDTARLEWALHKAFHASDDPAFDFSHFAEIPPEDQGRLLFQLSHSAHLLHSPWPVHEIWGMHQGQSSDTVDLDSGGAWLLIYRQHRELKVTPLTETTFQLLQRWQAQIPLGHLLDDETLATEIPSLLPLAIDHGWITGFALADH